MKGRVLLAKPGLDGHEAGVMLVSRALQDAGFEVIYLGLRQTAAKIASAAVSEDVDVIGLSVLTGGHLEHARELLKALEAADASSIPVVVGGIISEESAQELAACGVAATFGPGVSLARIVESISGLCDGDPPANR